MPASVRRARWQAAPAAPAAAAGLQAELGLSPLLALLLSQRGLTDPGQARLYLQGTAQDLPDPFAMLGMEEAVALLESALAAGEHIRVWGDYDVDGVAGTALLLRALGALGGHVSHYLPHRVQEGYGLNQAAIRRSAQEGVKLLVTVDCGIGAPAEVALARRLGMRVIVTDHHLPPPELPPADALLNPLRPGCSYPYPQLCGTGVAYKLLEALCRRRGLAPSAPWHFLDLVALATVSDVVPLLGENRLLVQAGLAAIARTRKEGLKALLAEAQLDPTQVGVYHLGFVLGPRLNAAGRLQHAEQALELLVTQDPAHAQELARSLSACNRQRQDEERRTLEQAVALVEEQCDLEQEWAIVLGRAQWHPGVIGIVASRLAERYCRPAVLVALKGERGRGSGRSIPGFHLYQALCECGDLLEHFGGHAAAAGLEVTAAHLPALRERLCTLAARDLTPEQLTPLVTVDAWVKPDQLTVDLGRELARMAPFGTGNPAPVLGLRQVTLLEARPVGDGSHLRLRLQGSPGDRQAIWFRYGYLAAHLQPPEPVDLLFQPSLGTWNGAQRLDLQVVDLAAPRDLPPLPPPPSPSPGSPSPRNGERAG